jgi:hypothetical protein
MSLATSGMRITLWEKPLVPGDYVHYEVGEILDAWRGNPVLPQPKPLPVDVKGGMEFSDPHKATVDKISTALQSLMKDQISSKELINRRDWR